MSTHNDHPTVILTSLANKKIPIDVEIAPLIQNLWSIGLKTLNSCQDNYVQYGSMKEKVHFVWIEFDGSSALKFAKLYINDNIERYNIVQTTWRFDADFINFHMFWDEIDECEIDWTPLDLHLCISVRFPIEQLPSVKDRFLHDGPPSESKK